MEPRIPIPTDNIYKFFALFGLAVFITAVVMQISVVRQTNDLAFSIAPQLIAINSLEKPSVAEKDMRELLEKRLDIAVRDREKMLGFAKLLMGVGGGLMGIGFAAWLFLVQPKHDRLLDSQVEKAELELKRMREIRCSRRRF